MVTLLRPELSTKNKYYIDKHRYYELKHFCLQYPEWKKAHAEFEDVSIPLSMIEHVSTDKLIEKTTIETDPYLYSYIIKGVTESKSYTYLETVLEIPCGKDLYYDRYRRFFWLLNKARE